MGDPISDAQSGKLGPVYILVSQQPLLLDRCVSALREAAVPEALRAFNVDAFDGKGGSGSRIAEVLRTLPMMAERRLVLLHNISAMPASELAHLVPYLADPNPSSVLVATAAKVDKRIKFFSAAKRKKYLYELEAPRRLTGWIRDEAAAKGVVLSGATATRLADVIGKDLARIALAIDQLALYAGDRAITVDDVDDLIADTRERSVFELTDAIGEGDLARALAAVTSLCDQRQSSIGVIIMLARHMRQLGLCHAGMADGLGKSDLSRLVGAPPFVVDKLMRQTRRYRPAAVCSALGKLAAADAELKGFTQVTKTLGRDLGERVLLDRVVRHVIATGGGGANG